MDWLSAIFKIHSSLQAIIVLSLISGIGLALGKLRLYGVSLGVTFVFFVGIFFGHIGFDIDPQVLNYVENFGLVLFVYALGLQVGEGFFSSFRKGGLKLNLLAIAVVLIGTLMALLFSYVLPVSLPDVIGVLCGATTNTPALGAAQQTLHQFHLNEATPALGCAVAYPLGVVGVILAMALLRKLFVGSKYYKTDNLKDEHKTYITSFHVENPATYNKKIEEIAKLTAVKFVISRVWRNGKLIIPTSEMLLKKHDRILVATQERDVETLTVLFGEHDKENWNRGDIDWNALDTELISHRYLITRQELNGKLLGSLRLRNLYGINISRVFRGGVELLATSDLRLQIGDRLTIVGRKDMLKCVEGVLGNRVKHLNEPNLVAVFIGLVLGVIIGAVPIPIANMATPIKLGLAGGPIVVGILMGTFGPRLHMITFVTRSASLMLQRLGLSLYLACLGLSSGVHFLATVMQGQGLLWITIGFVLTITPILLVGILAMRFYGLDFGTVSGMICGSMANPMALKYADDNTETDAPSLAYATVYPMSMFLRVIIVQLVLMFFL
jgi:AspT/YidE/YbjL antiporter-like protein